MLKDTVGVGASLYYRGGGTSIQSWSEALKEGTRYLTNGCYFKGLHGHFLNIKPKPTQFTQLTCPFCTKLKLIYLVEAVARLGGQ